MTEQPIKMQGIFPIISLSLINPEIHCETIKLEKQKSRNFAAE